MPAEPACFYYHGAAIRTVGDRIQSGALHFDPETVIIHASEKDPFDEELSSDGLEIITVFSASLYGSCRHKNKQVLYTLRQAAKTVSRS